MAYGKMPPRNENIAKNGATRRQTMANQTHRAEHGQIGLKKSFKREKMSDFSSVALPASAAATPTAASTAAAAATPTTPASANAAAPPTTPASANASTAAAVEKEMPTFRIGRNEHNRFTAAEVAEILFRHVGNMSNGFLCARMAYMSHYRETYKFSSVKELKVAIERYCTENDTSNFDYSSFYVYFAAGAYLGEITIIVNREDRRDFTRVLQREIRNGSTDAAKVYSELFCKDEGKHEQQVRGVDPAMCYLPPYYNSAGDHVGGGMPGVTYANFKTNPGAYK